MDIAKMQKVVVVASSVVIVGACAYDLYITARMRKHLTKMTEDRTNLFAEINETLNALKK